MGKGLLRVLIGFVITFGMWYWYNKNVLSKLDIEGQLAEIEYEYNDYEPEDYEEDDDGDYAYDDYDTQSDW